MVPPVELHLPATAVAPALARAALGPICSAISDDAGASVRIVVSELVANAVRHAGLDAREEITVRAIPNEVGVHVEVSDTGPAFGGSSVGDNRDGLGLFILKRLVTDWDIVRNGDQTTVWFDVAA